MPFFVFWTLPSISRITPGTNKHTYTNCRPVSDFSIFLKIIESSIFDQLIKHTTEFLQTFVGAYRKLYSCQHILICLIKFV